MPSFFRTTGKPRASIVDYMKWIEQSLIPAVNDRLSLSINNYPSRERETTVQYKDDTNGASLDISSNHVNLVNKNDLFVEVVYDGQRNEAGVINTSDLEESVDFIAEAFSEVGYETPQQKQEREEKEAIEKAEEEERKRQEAEAEKERRRQKAEDDARAEEERKANMPSEEEIAAQEREEFKAQLPEFEDEFDRTFNYIADLRPEEQTVNMEFLFLPDSEKAKTTSSFATVNLKVTHVAGNNFYVESSRIKPPVARVMTKEQLKEYALKIADKVMVYPSIEPKTAKGEPIVIPTEFDPDDFIELD